MNNIYLIGDSTCQTNTEETFPQTGWGQVFHEVLSDNYKVINLAKNGRSTKSFIDEGLFVEVQKNISKGDYLFIEFGHNDEKIDEARHTDPFTSYQENLLFFINTARRVGATPILMSSIYRRHFDESGKILENVHLSYPDACEDLAKKENVIYIDMCLLTKESLSKIGEKASREYFMFFDKGIYPNYIDGKNDNTHLRYKGARWVVDIVKDQMQKIPELKKLLK